MNKIYKYQLEVTDTQIISIPAGSDLLCVQSQNGVPCLWAVVNPKIKVFEQVEIIIHGTGHDVFDNIGQYLGTFQLMNGSFVGHCFKGLK